MAERGIWVQLLAEDNHHYFWNPWTADVRWEKPPCQVVWCGEKSPDGRMYYWNRETRQTQWDLPAVLPCREFVEIESTPLVAEKRQRAGGVGGPSPSTGGAGS